MTKQNKASLDYFPCAVRILDDPKVALVMIEHGHIVSTVILKLLGEIYGREGYWMPWDDECAMLFSLHTCHGTVSVDEAKTIVGALLKRGFFDQGVFERTGKLTSHGIQERWIEAMKKTHRVYSVDPELCLVEGEWEEKAPSEDFAKNSEDFAKSSEVVQKTSENFVVNKKKRKESNYIHTYLPTADTGASAGEEHRAPPKERVGRTPAPLRPPSGDPVRAEIARIFVPPGEFGIDRDLIDRTAAAVREGVPGLDPKNLKRIAKKADAAVALYDRSDGRRGKQYRWQTIADEVHARFRAAGRPWSEEWAGENEPPPLPRSSPMAAASPEPEPETTVDDLLAQLLDRDTDPKGETLDQTAKRLKCSTGQAVAERAAWRKLRELRQPASP